MQRTVVLNIVALSSSLIGENTPRIAQAARGGELRRLKPVLPAVTCSVQSSMLTGVPPSEHGVVGNGWYNREAAEVQFWKQSNHLVNGEKVWETARKRNPDFTVANMFWWYNMYSSTDYSVTPRPMYKADGRKIPDCYSHPASLRDELQTELGRFPLFNFWGPMTSIRSSQWIAEASKVVFDRFQPTLTLVYLPHLDYALQKLGPSHPEVPSHLRDIDEIVGDLIDYFNERDVRVILLSEYGIEPVDDAVPINRVLREQELIAVRVEEGGELLDAGASRAFAVADHQIAHVYCRDADEISRVEQLCASIPDVEHTLANERLAEVGLDHERSGDIVLVAERGKWFSYNYWLDDARAPDFARTVDIHRKPGYDPCELLLDPELSAAKLRIVSKLLLKKMGFRTLMDVVPLDPKLVRGSHGRIDQPPSEMPVLITPGNVCTDGRGDISCLAVRDVILRAIFGS